MPRAVEDVVADDGVWVPGVYAAVLSKERTKCEADDRRGPLQADPDNPSAGFFRRSRLLLAALEAGERVTVDSFRFPRGMVARDMFPDHDGHRYTVTPDDVVIPSAATYLDRGDSHS